MLRTCAVGFDFGGAALVAFGQLKKWYARPVRFRQEKTQAVHATPAKAMATRHDSLNLHDLAADPDSTLWFSRKCNHSPCGRSFGQSA
jgi:hypothetical protein